jgi:uncharacterized protein YbaP (TraB family)
MARLAVAVLAMLAALAVSCSAPAGRAPAKAPAVAGAPAATPGASSDPWADTTDEPPPSFAATRALADRACPKVAAPYFYRIEKGGKVSHILGTRHLGVSLDKMPANVVAAIRGAAVAVFEIAPGDDAAAAASGGPTISAQLGPELWARYRRLVGGALADALERATPVEAMVALIALYEHKLAALDHEIQQLALAAKIPTDGLESAAFQQRLLEELLDARMLRATVAGTPDRATLERESLEDLREYCAGTDDSPGLGRSEREELRAAGFTDAELDRIDRRLVFDRNDAWIPKLEQLLAGGGAFVAVGADHLTGARGVIALLAARGYRATRVAP